MQCIGVQWRCLCGAVTPTCGCRGGDVLVARDLLLRCRMRGERDRQCQPGCGDVYQNMCGLVVAHVKFVVLANGVGVFCRCFLL